MKATALCFAPLGGSILGLISFMIAQNLFEKEKGGDFLSLTPFIYIIALMVQLVIELAFFLLKFCVQFRLKEYCFLGFYGAIGFYILFDREPVIGYFFAMYTLGNILTYYFLYFRHLPEIQETDERK